MSKKVQCSGCGFLCWYSRLIEKARELDEKNRDELRKGIARGGYNFSEGEISIEYLFSCYRKRWTFDVYGDPTYKDVNQINPPRECKYFFRYEPGFGPEDHKDLLRDKVARKNVRNAALMGAVIGAAAAIIAQLIYAAVTNSG